MSDDVQQRLAEIRERVSVAKAGPWGVRIVDGGRWAEVYPENGQPVARLTDDDNAEFIAHARSDVPWLLEQHRTLVDAAAKAIVGVAADVALTRAALARVRKLHSLDDHGTGPQCAGCATHVTFTAWPCKTIRALEDEATS